MLAGDVVAGERDPEAHEFAVVDVDVDVDVVVNAAVGVVREHVLEGESVVVVIVAAVAAVVG